MTSSVKERLLFIVGALCVGQALYWLHPALLLLAAGVWLLAVSYACFLERQS